MTAKRQVERLQGIDLERESMRNQMRDERDMAVKAMHGYQDKVRAVRDWAELRQDGHPVKVKALLNILDAADPWPIPDTKPDLLRELRGLCSRCSRKPPTRRQVRATRAA